MINISSHIISLSSSLFGGECCGHMFREGRPFQPFKCSGDVEV